MVQTALYRISAWMLFVGAVLVTAGNLLGPQGSAREAVASGMYYPAAVVVLLGGVLVMAGLPALYLRRRAESGVLGFVAMMAVFAAGMLLTVGFALIQVLIFPWIATMNVSNKILNDGPVAFTIFFAVVSFIVSLGGVLFGVATIRARNFSPPTRHRLHHVHGSQLCSRLPEHPRGWRHRYVLVVGNYRDLWCDRLYGGPSLVCDRTSTTVETKDSPIILPDAVSISGKCERTILWLRLCRAARINSGVAHSSC